MPAKLRLQRLGKKGYAFYHIVVADSRAPRDGKFIENIGIYNPNTNPATIEINFDKAMSWLHKGAQPTETVKAILSYKGINYRRHLDEGVKKGAMTQEVADAKFTAWMEQKNNKVETKKGSLETQKRTTLDERFAAEKKIREDRAASLAKKAEAAVAPAAEEQAEPAAEAPAAEATAAE